MWNTSNVTSMQEMFTESRFQGEISEWDVSKVTNMYAVFDHSKFNGNISNWDVSNVTDMAYAFNHSQFTGDLSKWDVSNVRDMQGMFKNSQFNGDISSWNVSNVMDFHLMFEQSPFRGDISSWEISQEAEVEAFCTSVKAFDFSTIPALSLRVHDIFPNTSRLQKYLRIHPLSETHFYHSLQHATAPPYMRKPLFKWLKKHQSIAQSLGMDDASTAQYLYSQYKQGPAPLESTPLGIDLDYNMLQ